MNPHRILLLAWAFLSISLAVAQPALLELSSYPRAELSIRTARPAATHHFRIWVADTPERQSQGLMFVRDLPANEGMLFIHGELRVASMWMKNTFIPLDMLWIDSRGRITEIHANTTPHSVGSISAPMKVRAVLELRGGETARRGIRRGDVVFHPAFRSGALRGGKPTN
jgi:uncharacterized membrane protein (UPF0127 family)